MLIPILVFLVVYVAITFELVNKAAAALAGVGVLVVLQITSTFSRNQNIYLKEESKNVSGLNYTLISHSSDIVSLDLVDHIITDKGEIERDKLAEYCIA